MTTFFELYPFQIIYKKVGHIWNFCDQFITAAKPWRDLYRYAPDGTCLGWTRWVGDEKIEFNAEGHRILEKDAVGRATKVRTVVYRGSRSNPRQRSKLSCLDGDEIIRITYRAPGDYVGSPAARTKVGGTVPPETVAPAPGRGHEGKKVE